MDLCIFIISFVTPAGTRNPPETRGCGCRNAPAGLPTGGIFPTPRVCLRAGFHQTRTHIRGCHPYACALCSAPWRSLPAHATRHAQSTRKRGTSIRCSGANRQRRRRRPREHPPCHCLLEPLFSSLGLSSDIQTSAAAIFRTRRRRT